LKFKILSSWKNSGLMPKNPKNRKKNPQSKEASFQENPYEGGVTLGFIGIS